MAREGAGLRGESVRRTWFPHIRETGFRADGCALGADLPSAMCGSEALWTEFPERLSWTLSPSPIAAAYRSRRGAKSRETNAAAASGSVRATAFERFGGERRWWAESTAIPTV